MAGNQVWHVSCVTSVHAGFFQRTLDLLRGLWRSARGGIAAGHIDFQLICQQPTRCFIIPVPAGGSTYPAGAFHFGRGYRRIDDTRDLCLNCFKRRVK
jgi:hypothetical protein